MAKILVIEDDDDLRRTIRRALARAEHDVTDAISAATARAALAGAEFDAILTDVNLPDGSGLDVAREAREAGFEGVVIVMTAFATIEAAVRAMREGADDYVQKPLSLDGLALLVERSMERRALRSRVRLYERIERAKSLENELLGESPEWLKTIALVDRLAQAPMPAAQRDGAGDSPLPTALILGETGAGKGALARRLHERASAERPGAPFVHVNCSSIPASLIESELFGHEKGAFTDAKGAREGLFEMADGGTIFLDEIGDMPLELQTRLLLIVERGVFRRVGGTREKRVRVRVIAATHQDLEARVADGRFRRDLLFRLNALTVRIPALRERGRDSLLITRAMLARFGAEVGRPCLTLSARAEAAVLAHDWPGNVREVSNAAQRAAMLSEGPEVEADELGLAPAPAHAPAAAEEGSNGVARPGPGAAASGVVFDFARGTHTLAGVERALILQALAHCAGNVSRAARLIGMSRGNLRHRIEQDGLGGAVEELSR